MELALQAAYDSPGVHRWRLGSCLVTKSGIIKGQNQFKSHPIQKQYATHHERIFLHAEIDSIRKAKGADLDNSVMYVARFKSNGTQGNACPCEGCQAAMIAYGIKTVYYSTGVIESPVACLSFT